jgi:pimeloyl-ACP methyl ester carboxylesterase
LTTRPRPVPGTSNFREKTTRKWLPIQTTGPNFFDKFGSIQWEGFSDEGLASINAPFLILLGDHDFVRLEHAVETVKLMPKAEFAVIPSASHFVLFSEPERVIPIIKHFLEKPEKSIPLATAETGYHPTETR